MVVNPSKIVKINLVMTYLFGKSTYAQMAEAMVLLKPIHGSYILSIQEKHGMPMPIEIYKELLPYPLQVLMLFLFPVPQNSSVTVRSIIPLIVFSIIW